MILCTELRNGYAFESFAELQSVKKFCLQEDVTVALRGAWDMASMQIGEAVAFLNVEEKQIE